ncbi:MAG TPA: hypothetical protein VFE06_08610 [Acidobacteriaceae bacterium]|jgi:DNA-binding NtrC family response regulator|nr:hypothetical protein [Acidobacteriaceae bacterium]
MLTAIQIGADPALLWSRAAIVETAGLRVVNAADVPQALERIRGVPFDLVVLCHSLPRAHRLQVIAATRRRNPSVPILLVGGGYGAHTAVKDGIDVVLDSEPQTLLLSLRRVLRLPEAEGAAPALGARCNSAAGQA